MIWQKGQVSRLKAYCYNIEIGAHFLKKILTYTVKISSLDIHETVNPCTQVSFAEKTEYNL